MLFADSTHNTYQFGLLDNPDTAVVLAAPPVDMSLEFMQGYMVVTAFNKITSTLNDKLQVVERCTSSLTVLATTAATYAFINANSPQGTACMLHYGHIGRLQCMQFCWCMSRNLHDS
jgi:hypothetical protein